MVILGVMGVAKSRKKKFRLADPPRPVHNSVDDDGSRAVSGQGEEYQHAADKERAIDESRVNEQAEERETDDECSGESKQSAFDRPVGGIHAIEGHSFFLR